MPPSGSLAHILPSINRLVLAGFSGSFVAINATSLSPAPPRAAPAADEKSSSIWMFAAAVIVFETHGLPPPLLLVRAFDPRFRLGLSVSSTFRFSECLTSPRRRHDLLRRPIADFCSAVRLPLAAQSPKRHGADLLGQAQSLSVHNRRIYASLHLDGLWIFEVRCPLVRQSFVHRLARLLNASLQTPPRGSSPCIITRPLPPSGRLEDFHLQVTEHAQHTTKPLLADAC